MRARPMPALRPLNVDKYLPLPEAGQASTVFSLTALFGAYFGIYLVLGIPALAGIAFGTVCSLFTIRSWIQNHGVQTFEDFLLSTLSGSRGNASSFALTVSAVQCAYAASELLILREIARVSLGIRSDHATLLAVAVGIIGYFYVLFGGYMAVYRTDVLQFVLVAVMAVALSIYSVELGSPVAWTRGLWPRPGYWVPPVLGTLGGYWRYAYHFAIGVVMGFGLLAAAPDAWKRVFVVTTLRKKTFVRFATFVGVGIMPFLVLLPLAATMPAVPDGPVNAGQLFSNLLGNNFLFVAASLGLIASFLSSFDSALLASVHVGLMLQREQKPVEVETPRFHWLMVTAMFAIFLLFGGLASLSNPYLLANLLLGLYAIIAGIQTGTGAMPARLPENSVLWIVVVAFVGWFLYFVSVLSLPKVPTTYEVNTVPGGVLIFLTIVFVCKLLAKGGHRNA